MPEALRARAGAAAELARVGRHVTEFLGIDHVQLGMPHDGGVRARAFYAHVLGLDEIAPPPPLGGLWFRAGGVELHLTVEPNFRAAPKSHPALRVRGLTALAARCAAAGHAPELDTRYPGRTRYFVRDPFGNRIELLQLAGDGD
jgi:catechol 2,3-dioxygenase-like lactoylglutathione lyase family enzyme